MNPKSIEVITYFHIQTPIKPCPRPRVGGKSKNTFLPKHGEKALELEIAARLLENNLTPRGTRYNAICVMFASGRGDIDNRLKTLMDALANVTGQNDCAIKFVKCLISDSPTSFVSLGWYKPGEENEIN